MQVNVRLMYSLGFTTCSVSFFFSVFCYCISIWCKTINCKHSKRRACTMGFDSLGNHSSLWSLTGHPTSVSTESNYLFPLLIGSLFTECLFETAMGVVYHSLDVTWAHLERIASFFSFYISIDICVLLVSLLAWNLRCPLCCGICPSVPNVY